MNLGRKVTDNLWRPYGARYTTSISVIERPEKKDDEEPTKQVPKVPFGFARFLEES